MDKTHRTDRRTRYTRQAIKEILLEELKTKPYSKITVTEICKKAEMNRGTFYLHYLTNRPCACCPHGQKAI